jgi:2,4-dienoyl-CoA reductase-like NADH-dependent reductase (Old Yellow Enzyme family)/thioredoxin reductase
MTSVLRKIVAVSNLGDPLRLTDSILLRNRIVATAHGTGAVESGIPGRGEDSYWRRLAAGGAAMVVAGGSAVSPESTYRRGNITEMWRSEVVPRLRARAGAISDEGAIAIMQLVHLGRETLGAEGYYAPVAPSPVRSPREPSVPRMLADAEVDEVVESFSVSARHALEAGFHGIELHAAHGYLLGQFLSPTVNRRPGVHSAVERHAPVWRIVDAIHETDPRCVIGIRLAVGDSSDAGLEIWQLGELLRQLHPAIRYVNLAVGMRGTYVRDMATERPPALSFLEQVRPLTELPLLVSQGFRDHQATKQALESGADLIGMTRALIADPDLPRKVLAGDHAQVRPCVACNEDCRAFDPTLLCSVNPSLAPPGESARPASPLARGPSPVPAPRRVGIVGAGPAGLECATELTRTGTCEVIVWECAEEIGGGLRLAGSAPHRRGWLRMVDFYRHQLEAQNVELRLGHRVGRSELDGVDAVVVAVGAEEIAAIPDGAGFVWSTSAALAAGPPAFRGASHVVVVDDGFGWWPSVSAVELAVAAGVNEVTVVTPGASFAGSVPAESRTQLTPRLRSVKFSMRPFTTLVRATDGSVELRDAADRESTMSADAVLVVGERRPRDWKSLVPDQTPVLVCGDAITPRKFGHAIAEGRAAARAVAGPPPSDSVPRARSGGRFATPFLPQS